MRVSEVPEALLSLANASGRALVTSGARLLDGDPDPAGDAAVDRYVEAEPTEVWDLLVAPERHLDWGLGVRTVDAHSPDWPAEGSWVAWTAGWPPASLGGRTRVVRNEDPGVLEVDVDARWAGTLRVTARLTPMGTGTRLTLDERPVSGPMAQLWNPVQAAATAARLTLVLRRVCDQVEAHTPPDLPT